MSKKGNKVVWSGYLVLRMRDYDILAYTEVTKGKKYHVAHPMRMIYGFDPTTQAFQIGMTPWFVPGVITNNWFTINEHDIISVATPNDFLIKKAESIIETITNLGHSGNVIMEDEDDDDLEIIDKTNDLQVEENISVEPSVTSDKKPRIKRGVKVSKEKKETSPKVIERFDNPNTSMDKDTMNKLAEVLKGFKAGSKGS